MKKINIIVTLCYCFLFVSCRSEVDKIYINRNEIQGLFNGVTIIRRGELLHFEFMKNSLTNVFIFKEIKGSSDLSFLRDSIQFELDSLENYGLQKWNNNEELEQELQKRLHFLLRVMKKFEIKGITSEFSSFGISLYIYLPQKIMFYVPNLYVVKNKEWLSLVKSANKLDDNWYWEKY